MTTTLRAKITTSGFDLLAGVLAGTAQPIEIAHIALGTGSIDIGAPGSEAITLSQLVVQETIRVSGIHKIGAHRVHVTGIADNPDTAYGVRTIGFVTTGGVLFAYMGNVHEPFMAKLRDQNLLLAFDLDLGESSAEALKIGPGERLNLNMTGEFAAMALANLSLQKALAEIMGRLQRIEGIIGL